MIWDNKVIVPVTRDVVRGVIGKDADVYKLNQNREQYAEDIKFELDTRVNAALKKQCVTFEMVSIRDIKLPSQLMDSIMKKNQMQEESLRAELEIKKAEAEAKIKVAKAQGDAEAMLTNARAEAEANKLKNSTLTPLLVQMRWIEAWQEGGSHVPTYVTGAAGNSFMMSMK